jgi:WhiB family redox-sensing transcriptional regulator
MEYPPPGEWRRYGACREHPTWMFFGEGSSSVVSICAECPVLEDCRAYALAAPRELEGVWGGLGRSARDRIRRNGSLGVAS